MVTAELQPFARSGRRLDALVNSIGDAKTLGGGTLLMTPLKGADGQVYAVAQGPVATGGFLVGSGTGDKVAKNFPTVGRVVQGASVEREIPFDLNQKDSLSLALNRPDFTTATRVAQAINTGLMIQWPALRTPAPFRSPCRCYYGNIAQLTAIEGFN
jgi:flagellar P-ring protein precursor FlgI